jgi:hypothetical protein
VAADYVISVAGMFQAHVAGIGFGYEMPIPGSVFSSTVVRLIAAQRAENEKAAQTAISNFDAAARGVGLSAESHLLKSSLADAANTFGQLFGMMRS